MIQYYTKNVGKNSQKSQNYGKSKDKIIKEVLERKRITKKNYYNTGTILFTNHPTIDRKWSGRNPLVWQKMI